MAIPIEKAPAQPTYILRGHSAQIHAVHFFRGNASLLTGDADGWLVVWSTTTRRGEAVWRAHTMAILGVRDWGDDRIITHGRDNKLIVWQLRRGDEQSLSRLLPIDDTATARRQPWLLHSLRVNSTNFCAFAQCQLPDSDSLLVATPGVHDGHVQVTALPSEQRVATIPSPKGINTGMLMAIGLCMRSSSSGRQLADPISVAAASEIAAAVQVLAAYESGHVGVWQQQAGTGQWQPAFLAQPHTQPVLSLAAAPSLGCFFTSGADAVIARHPLPASAAGAVAGAEAAVAQTVQTRHAGQQSLAVRADDRLFATAGWDGRVRVYAAATMRELAVLKWHKEGCYAVAFAQVGEFANDDETDGALSKRDFTVSELRTRAARTTHWVAAGSKDGKVSLWDIY